MAHSSWQNTVTSILVTHLIKKERCCWNLRGYKFKITSVLYFPHDRGIGVVGEQPLILPGNSFEYSSACPLSTPNGRMVRFTFVVAISWDNQKHEIFQYFRYYAIKFKYSTIVLIHMYYNCAILVFRFPWPKLDFLDSGFLQSWSFRQSFIKYLTDILDVTLNVNVVMCVFILLVSLWSFMVAISERSRV